MCCGAKISRFGDELYMNRSICRLLPQLVFTCMALWPAVVYAEPASPDRINEQARKDVQALRELCRGDKDVREIKKAGSKSISSLAKMRSEAMPLLLNEFRQESNDWKFRYLILEQLSRTKDNRVVDVVTPALHDAHAEIRRLSVVALGASGQEQVAPTLHALLADNDMEIRLYSVQGLGKLRHPKSLEHLIRRFHEEPYFGVRMSIAESLGNYRGKEVIDALVQALKNDTSPDVRARTAWVLGESKTQEAAGSLCGSLDDRYVVVSLNAAQALGKMKSQACVPLLIKALNRNILRIEAANALGEIGDPAAISPLEKLANTKDMALDHAVQTALEKIKRQRG